MSIRLRILVAYVLLMSVGLCEMVRWMLREVRPRYLESAEEALVDTSTILAALLATDIQDQRIDPARFRTCFADAYGRQLRAVIYGEIKDKVNLRVYVTDERGIVLFDSDRGKDEGKDYSQWNDVIRALRGEYGARTTRTDPEDVRTEVLCVASPILYDGLTVGVLTVCKPIQAMNAFIDDARRRVVMAGLLSGSVAIVLGVVLSVWLTRPIQNLTRYAQSVRDGRRAALPRLGRSEISVLGSAFEEMRQALEGKRYVEQYVQALTHEIKGPLSAIRGAAELLDEDMPSEQRKRFASNVLHEARRIQNIVDRLLQLSSLESRRDLADAVIVNVRDVAREVAEEMAPAALSKGIHLAVHGQEDAMVKGERALLVQAVTNLLQNAIEFTPRNGEITLTVSVRPGEADIIVDDSGPGIPDYALDRVFEKFFSLPHPDTGAKSSGLGLSFVREVALLHAGRVTLVNRPQGGARATLTLPTSPLLGEGRPYRLCQNAGPSPGKNGSSPLEGEE